MQIPFATPRSVASGDVGSRSLGLAVHGSRSGDVGVRRYHWSLCPSLPPASNKAKDRQERKTILMHRTGGVAWNVPVRHAAGRRRSVVAFEKLMPLSERCGRLMAPRTNPDSLFNPSFLVLVQVNVVLQVMCACRRLHVRDTDLRTPATTTTTTTTTTNEDIQRTTKRKAKSEMTRKRR